MKKLLCLIFIMGFGVVLTGCFGESKKTTKAKTTTTSSVVVDDDTVVNLTPVQIQKYFELFLGETIKDDNFTIAIDGDITVKNEGEKTEDNYTITYKVDGIVQVVEQGVYFSINSTVTSTSEAKSMEESSFREYYAKVKNGGLLFAMREGADKDHLGTWESKFTGDFGLEETLDLSSLVDLGKEMADSMTDVDDDTKALFYNIFCRQGNKFYINVEKAADAYNAFYEYAKEQIEEEDENNVSLEEYKSFYKNIETAEIFFTAASNAFNNAKIVLKTNGTIDDIKTTIDLAVEAKVENIGTTEITFNDTIFDLSVLEEPEE